MPENTQPVKRTIELEVPKKASIQDYLLIVRRVLAHPKVVSINITAGTNVKVTYIQVPGEDTLEERIVPKKTLEDLLDTVPIVRINASGKEGVLAAIGRIIMESWTETTPASFCFARDREVLKSLLGWRGGTTFMGMQLILVPDFLENMLVIGVANDVLDSLDGVQALYGISL